MLNRHVVIKQRAPSTKAVIARIKEAMKSDPEGRRFYQRALEYWQNKGAGVDPAPKEEL